MVKIAGFDFNRDLDSYIEKKRKTSGTFSIKSGKERVAEEPEDYDEEPKAKKPVNLSTILRRRIPSDEEVARENKMKAKQEEKEIEEEIEDLDEAEDEIEQEKETLMMKLKKIFGGKNKEEMYEEAEIEAAQQEQAMVEEKVKETLKILHRWLEQLPPDKLEQFKRSADFVKYKELLRELGMIKK